MKQFWTTQTRLSSVLAALAGFVGAAAYAHSSGYFVTFMTGNTERAALGYFHGDVQMALGALSLIIIFMVGVFVASLGRRHLWSNHPYGATLVTSIALTIGALTGALAHGHGHTLRFLPIAFVSFGMGALNTAFVKDGEVSIPLSYVTGTVVKLAQGLERHFSGGTILDWLAHGVLYASFIIGALAGGVVASIVGGSWMLLAAAIVAGLTTFYTRKVVLPDGFTHAQRGQTGSR